MASIIDSYSETNQDSQFAGNGTTRAQIGQSITGNGASVGTAQFYLKKGVGSPSGNLTAAIYSISGTSGTNATPNVLLATSDTVDAATVTSTSFSLFTFTFSGGSQITLT